MEISIDNLIKFYTNESVVLKGINTNLKNGITGLIGPNGAGKSTLIKILVGLEKVSSGHIHYLDHSEPSFNLKASLGYVPQNFQLPNNLTGEEFLDFMSTAKGIGYRTAKQNSLQLLDLLNLTQVARKRISTYSGGMKQRLGIAQSLLNHPKLLILDEPTVGLDPDERLNLKHIMTELAENTVILLSTHIVSDIESVANHIIILDQGEIQVQGNTDALLKTIDGKVWELTVSPEEYQNKQQEYFISNTFHKQNKIEMRVISKKQPKDEANLIYPTLEDLYLYHIRYKKANREKQVAL
ncbi:ATP-binding cassette domain-containing protein [Melissococcus plutonius]|uniref:ABC transporter, ATP-binding protein n=1 Tax=Melissococcus plutonius TaxID=33970 RepID=A0A2Z5Y437_9ENTE|nr:ATP-binding cassette domain-containing protein [Melissococcus plutonius]BAL62727.1 ABC transporter ATP-binding protein [Melissococcus plutonius DAT561]MCV2498644.1 ATP-binding cassette domain-containing protein [Melissococcus plutonius]MCV2500753.1 ATP-binding cassette domain-containing protein [Melissococcus plutonius]MCV2504689.1 ATP-binding cassette domain-containing protein [Melissococcus plutonius]MCV2507148.1 ATP-binding cassette domain-containing protein [Melissococcus plutonius]